MVLLSFFTPFPWPPLRIGNEYNGLRPIIFRAQNILLSLPTIIENKKSIILKERKHTTVL
jgi:hypothetical protein